MSEFTHEIVRMERGATKNSGSPMWRCTTADGVRVNVFQHSDPHKDNTLLFKVAGYFDLMNGLKNGESLGWSQHPIKVILNKEGEWWTVSGVCVRLTDAEPDVMWQPNLKMYQERAVRHAVRLLVDETRLRIVDLEMTGVTSDDEITAIGIYDGAGTLMLDTNVNAPNPEKLLRMGKAGMTAADVTGISPSDLVDAPTFAELHQRIFEILEDADFVAYNAPFDCEGLDRECSNNELPLISRRSVHDVAVLAAEYLGNWNEKRQWFELMKLGEAASRLGIMTDVQHKAGEDALTALKVLKAIASDEGTLDEPF